MANFEMQPTPYLPDGHLGPRGFTEAQELQAGGEYKAAPHISKVLRFEQTEQTTANPGYREFQLTVKGVKAHGPGRLWVVSPGKAEGNESAFVETSMRLNNTNDDNAYSFNMGRVHGPVYSITYNGSVNNISVSPGWRVVEEPKAETFVVQRDTNQEYSLQSGPFSASYEVAAGRSYVLFELPCEVHPGIAKPVPQAIGQGTLTGGDAYMRGGPITCTGEKWEAAKADGPTTWEARGNVYGVSGDPIVMIGLTLPERQTAPAAMPTPVLTTRNHANASPEPTHSMSPGPGRETSLPAAPSALPGHAIPTPEHVSPTASVQAREPGQPSSPSPEGMVAPLVVLPALLAAVGVRYFRHWRQGLQKS